MREMGPKRLCWTARLGAALLAAGLGVGLAVGVPANVRAQQADPEVNDPIEGFNRSIFEFNRGADRYVIRPVAEGYRYIFPGPVRDGIRNVLRNARTPVFLANDLLQAEWTRAGETLQRFAINTLLGIGGIFDVAEATGAPAFHAEDFGQTLGVWGSGEGPYFVLPILGPAPPRDAAGLVADTLMDPFTWYLRNIDLEWVSYARFAAEGIDLRSRNIETLDEIERGAIDFYATIRSLYRQRRDDEIRNGRPGSLTRLPDIPMDMSADDRPGRTAATR
jgi:phospholipid-binding lipoprotein MlaA